MSREMWNKVAVNREQQKSETFQIRNKDGRMWLEAQVATQSSASVDPGVAEEAAVPPQLAAIS